MLNSGKLGREGGIQQFDNIIGLIALSFPKEVVVVSDGADAQFSDQAAETNTQGQIHGDGEGILNHDTI